MISRLKSPNSSSWLLPRFSSRFLNSSSTQFSPSKTPGIIFDIDGVLVRGGNVLPEAKSTFKKLYCHDTQKFKLPIVFVTNAGNSLRSTKAEALTKLLETPIKKEQVVMSHTPLRTLKNNQDKFSLISGQGPITEIANKLGFHKTITVTDLRERMPYLDMTCHDTRPDNRNISDYAHLHDFPKIEQVVLFGEPNRWETNLQFILDCIITEGDFWRNNTQKDYELNGVLGRKSEHIPIIGANMDLQWQAEAPGPRFGHGMFMTTLEAAYAKLTNGKKLNYTALAGKPSPMTYEYAEKILKEMVQESGNEVELGDVYCIGDNIMSDIFGANLYSTISTRKFHSMLVSTGVWHKPDGFDLDLSQEELRKVFKELESCNFAHAPRDYVPDGDMWHGETVETLLVPDFIIENVEGCIDHVLSRNL